MLFRFHPDRDALFLDIDGTLLDIASTPGAVIVPPVLLHNLAALHAKLGGALALISGRTLSEIDALFTPLRLPASGAHGAECRVTTVKEASSVLPEAFRKHVIETFASYPALLIEDKKYSMAVHYRQAPGMSHAVETLLKEMIVKADEPLTILPGKMVYEVVYPWHNKGAALERFMTYPPFAGRRPVFIGDDETDVFAIHACRKLGGIADHVGRGECFFSTPSDVREWIAEQVSYG